MVIRPMIPYLTMSEIHAVMTSGFATVTGSNLAAYIAIGVSIILLRSGVFISLFVGRLVGWFVRSRRSL